VAQGVGPEFFLKSHFLFIYKIGEQEVGLVLPGGGGVVSVGGRRRWGKDVGG
jgi:hypothetical protein